MKMLEKRLWPNLAFILLSLLICITIWQITTDPASFTGVTQHSTTVYSLYTYNSTGYHYPIYTLPNNDYNQLIDLNFTFGILNFVCNDTVPFLFIAVHSAAKNFQKRRVIRETWGQNTHNIRVVYMIGMSEDLKLQRELEQENELYGDLVQGQFLDTYRNITYKHLMVFKYVIYYCPFAKYILKTDDDVFVNIPALLNFLTTDLSPYGASRLLFCTPRRNVSPSRTYRSKWRVSFKEYSAKKYPTYCPGWVLLYSPDVVFNLYQIGQKSHYFWIDDVHITGLLAEKAGIFISDIEKLVLTAANQKYLINHNKTKPFLFGRPNLSSKVIKILWKFVKTHDTPKSLIRLLN